MTKARKILHSHHLFAVSIGLSLICLTVFILLRKKMSDKEKQKNKKAGEYKDLFTALIFLSLLVLVFSIVIHFTKSV